jgi:hypothetical protein
MTIKTVLKLTNARITTTPSDMTKHSAVKKNLFGTTVDREELQQQLRQLSDESNQNIDRYRVEGVLGYIERSESDKEASKSGKLKRLPLAGDSDDDSDSDESARDEASSSSSSTPPPPATSSPLPTSSNQISSGKSNSAQRTHRLPRGQTTIKGKSSFTRAANGHQANKFFPSLPF